MKAFLKINIICLCLLAGYVSAQVSDDVNISAEISAESRPACNNNGICEPGETFETCPQDCRQMRGGIELLIYNIKVRLSISNFNFNNADISWDNSKPALCRIYWGKTAEYKDGVILEDSFKENHSVLLDGLSPETTYHFQIDCEDDFGIKKQTNDQQFTTLPIFDKSAPLNVNDLIAVPGDKKIELSWKNPSDIDFNGVRIIRSDRFYPNSIDDGEIIYEGRGSYFEDTGLINGKRYYYSVFAYDKSRNYSSGAIASAVPNSEGKEKLPEVIEGPVTPEIEKITISDFEFYANGERVLLKNDKTIEIDSEIPLTALIRYEKTPEVLKTIMVSLEKNKKFFSFLLRINKDKTYYSANIISPKDPGIYPMVITILDYKNQALKRIEGELVVNGKKTEKSSNLLLVISLLFLLVLLAIILFVVFRKKEDKK